MQVAAAHGQEVRDVLLDIVRGDGQTRTLLANAVPLRDADGQPRGAVGAFVHMTERLAADAEKARLRAENLRQSEFLDQLITDESGQVVAGMGMGFDITERVRMADQVRQTSVQIERERDLLRTILTSITDEVWYSDAEQNFYLANPAAVHGFGFAKPDATFLPLPEWHDLEIHNPDGTLRPYDDAPLLRALRGEVIPYGEEIARRLDTGELRYRQFSAAPIHDATGQIIGSVAAVRDVTPLKEAAQERERLLAELQDNINEQMLARREAQAQAAAAKAAQEQAERLAAERQAVLDAIADGLIVYDIEGRIVRQNNAAADMLGYGLDTQKLPIGERSTAVVQPRKADGSPFTPDEYPAERALKGEVVRNQEMILSVPARAGGSLRVSVSSAPIRAQDGTVAGCVTTFTNTEAFHEANERLRQANAESEAILSALAQGLVVYDARGQIARINKRGREMLGYSEDALKLPASERVGISARAFRPDGSAVLGDEHITLRALRGEVVRDEEEYVHFPERPDGDFWGIFSAGPILGPDRQALGTVLTWVDTSKLHAISEQLAAANAQLQAQADELRKAAARLEQRVQERTAELSQREAALAQANASLREQADLLDLTHDAIFVRGLDGTLRLWNRGAVETYGWTPAEALGQVSHRLLRTIFPQPLPEIEAQVIAQGSWEGELIHTRRNSTQVSMSSRWALQRDEAGRPLAIMETNNDISRYKQAEAQREAVLQTLEESRSQLRTLSRRLVEIQERERSEVADRLYNQAGQVLAALKMQLRLLEKEQPEPSLVQQWAEMKTTVDRAMHELHELATQLRPVSLDHSGLGSALKQYLAEFGQEHNLAVQFSAQGAEGLQLRTEVVTAVYRAVQEALANTAQHARAGQVTLVLSRMDDFLMVALEDNGVGFDPASAQRRGGVGLVSMRERIEAVGGHLAVESRPGGGGTSVVIEVPLDMGD